MSTRSRSVTTNSTKLKYTTITKGKLLVSTMKSNLKVFSGYHVPYEVIYNMMVKVGHKLQYEGLDNILTEKFINTRLKDWEHQFGYGYTVENFGDEHFEPNAREFDKRLRFTGDLHIPLDIYGKNPEYFTDFKKKSKNTLEKMRKSWSGTIRLPPCASLEEISKCNCVRRPLRVRCLYCRTRLRKQVVIKLETLSAKKARATLEKMKKLKKLSIKLPGISPAVLKHIMQNKSRSEIANVQPGNPQKEAEASPCSSAGQSSYDHQEHAVQQLLQVEPVEPDPEEEEEHQDVNSSKSSSNGNGDCGNCVCELKTVGPASAIKLRPFRVRLTKVHVNTIGLKEPRQMHKIPRIVLKRCSTATTTLQEQSAPALNPEPSTPSSPERSLPGSPPQPSTSGRARRTAPTPTPEEPSTSASVKPAPTPEPSTSARARRSAARIPHSTTSASASGRKAKRRTRKKPIEWESDPEMNMTLYWHKIRKHLPSRAPSWVNGGGNPHFIYNGAPHPRIPYSELKRRLFGNVEQQVPPAHVQLKSELLGRVERGEQIPCFSFAKGREVPLTAEMIENLRSKPVLEIKLATSPTFAPTQE